MNESLRRLIVATYAVAAFFVFSPILDVITNSWPVELGQEVWRFGVVGVASNYLVSVLFGMILGALLAATAGHRAMLRFIGWLAWATVAILALMVISLALDTLQLRSSVRPDALVMFKIGVVKTTMKIGGVIIVLVLLAIGCMKAAREDASVRSDRDRGPLIIRT